MKETLKLLIVKLLFKAIYTGLDFKKRRRFKFKPRKTTTVVFGIIAAPIFFVTAGVNAVRDMLKDLYKEQSWSSYYLEEHESWKDAYKKF